jgi:RND family efflux transporter MFP subunit
MLLLIAGCSAPAPAPSVKRAVRVTTIARRDVDTATRYSAALEPREKVDLTFKTAGKLRSLAQVGEGDARRPIQEGDVVRRGQELARLDDDDYVSQAKVAAAGVSSAEAQIHAAEAALQQASAEFARAKALRDGAAISQADLDRTQTAVRTARANLEGARSQRLSRSEQQALARGVVDDAALLSPIDGVVARRMVEVGSSVTPGTVAFTVIDPGQMRAVFGVPDLHVGALRLGDRVAIHLDALPGKVLAGQISKIHPTADPQLRSFAVEVSVANADGDLRAGMVATAAIAGAGQGAAAVGPQGALLVPLAAVVRPPRGQGFAVWALDPKTSKVALRPISPGDLSGNELIVHAGLKVGEQIVTDGAAWLYDGESVEVVP